MRVLIVLNPAAGRGRAAWLARELAAILSRRGHLVETVQTGVLGRGEIFPRRGPSSPDVVCIAGGDGTVSSVVKELGGAGAPRLALLPCGTANQLARELALPRSPREVARLMEAGRTLSLPAGRVNQSIFLFNVSSGFDALVCESIQREGRGALGFRGYFLPILKSSFGYRPPDLTVRIDGSETLHCGWALVSNIGNYGGIFRVARGAALEHGLFHVLALPRGSRREIIRAAFSGLFSSLSRTRRAAYRVSKKVEISSLSPAPVQADGEYIGATPVNVEAGAAAVEMLVP